MISFVTLILFSCFGLALAEYCYYYGSLKYCAYGCCGTYNNCCSYQMNGGGIAGLVIGIITFIAIIAAIVICCRRRRAYLGRPVYVPQGAGTAGVTVVQTSQQQQSGMCSQPMAYPQYPPSAPNYYPPGPQGYPAVGPQGYPAAGPQGYPAAGPQGYPPADQKGYGVMPQGQGYVGPYPGNQQQAPPPYQ